MPEPEKLRIVSDGTARGTRVTRQGSDERLMVTGFSVSAPDPDSVVTGAVSVIVPEVDVVADCEIHETSATGYRLVRIADELVAKLEQEGSEPVRVFEIQRNDGGVLELILGTTPGASGHNERAASAWTSSTFGTTQSIFSWPNNPSPIRISTLSSSSSTRNHS